MSNELTGLADLKFELAYDGILLWGQGPHIRECEECRPLALRLCALILSNLAYQGKTTEHDRTADAQGTEH